MYYVDNGQIEILSDGSRKDLGPSARKDVSTAGNYHIRQFMKDSSNRIGSYTFCYVLDSCFHTSKLLNFKVLIFDLKRSGSVVECLTRDRRAAGLSLTGVTALWSLSKTHLS